MSSGSMSTPSSSRTYRDHSGELMPSISCVASSFQRPPRSATSSRRAPSHASSESTSTPSRSRTTASGLCVIEWFSLVDERPELADGEREAGEVGALPGERASEAGQPGDALLVGGEEALDRLLGLGGGRLGGGALGDEPPGGEHVVADRLQRPALQPRADRQALDLAFEPRELQPVAEREEGAADVLDAAAGDPRDRDDVGRMLERAAVGVVACHVLRYALLDEVGGGLLALGAPVLGAQRRQHVGELGVRRTALLDLPAEVEAGLG